MSAWDAAERVLDKIVKADIATYIRLIIVLVAIACISPFVVRYFHGPTRMSQEIDLLHKLNKISIDELSDSRLQIFYNKLLDEVSQINGSKLAVEYKFEKPKFKELFKYKYIVKFFSASIMIIFLMISVIFQKMSFIEKFFSLFVFSIIIVIFGLSGVYFFPTFDPFFLNYLLLPTIEIIVILIIAYKLAKDKE